MLRYLGLLDIGCPIGRHELTDDEWLLLGKLRDERMIIAKEEQTEDQDG